MSCDFEYKLSVVVLVYNTEYYLEECLDSLVNQTLDGIEIICVNDESTDGSLNILKKYAREYDNIKIINQKNQGGAIAGNNGLKVAKGEYVTLMDSDDIVVLDAYEKMYKKAKETNSDIVSGKPNFYISGFQREVIKKNNIWDREKTFNIDEYLDIFYDVFYWNKIYKRELIEKHDIYMIPDKIYADVPLVFRAYLFANKISIIPDLVYLWRRRSQEDIIQGNSDISISKSLLDIKNMEDRLSTYYYLKDYFTETNNEKYFNRVIKTYLERFFYPINGILKDKNFKKAYLNVLKDILCDIDDVYDNNLDLKYNLFIYFILNDLSDELDDFLNFDLKEQSTIVKNNKTYWNLKYFDNSKYNIPVELFEIKKVEENFIKIDDLYSDSQYIYFKNVKIPINIEVNSVNISFVGLTKKYGILEENIYSFNLEENDEINSFSGKINLDDLDNINTYDIFLEVVSIGGNKELFRLKEFNFLKNNVKILSRNPNIKFHFTKFGNFSIISSYCKDFFEIFANDNCIKIIPNKNKPINYKIYIKYKRKYDRVYFTFDEDNREFYLEWKYALDKNILYNIYLEIGRGRFKLSKNQLNNFNDQVIKYGNNKIKLYNSNNIGIIMK